MWAGDRLRDDQTRILPMEPNCPIPRISAGGSRTPDALRVITAKNIRLNCEKFYDRLNHGLAVHQLYPTLAQRTVDDLTGCV